MGKTKILIKFMSQADNQHQQLPEGINLMCPNGKRQMECFCTDCLMLICPNCLMFGAHKGCPVAPIPEAANLIRGDIDKAIKEGLFKASRTNDILLDIRHTKLQCEETKDKLTREINSTFFSLQQ